MYTSEDCLRVVFNLTSSTDSNDFLTSVLNPKMDTGCDANNSNVVWVEMLYLALQLYMMQHLILTGLDWLEITQSFLIVTNINGIKLLVINACLDLT